MSPGMGVQAPHRAARGPGLASPDPESLTTQRWQAKRYIPQLTRGFGPTLPPQAAGAAAGDLPSGPEHFPHSRGRPVVSVTRPPQCNTRGPGKARGDTEAQKPSPGSALTRSAWAFPQSHLATARAAGADLGSTARGTRVPRPDHQAAWEWGHKLSLNETAAGRRSRFPRQPVNGPPSPALLEGSCRLTSLSAQSPSAHGHRQYPPEFASRSHSPTTQAKGDLEDGEASRDSCCQQLEVLPTPQDTQLHAAASGPRERRRESDQQGGTRAAPQGRGSRGPAWPAMGPQGASRCADSL